jgi:flagellar protein FlaF
MQTAPAVRAAYARPDTPVRSPRALEYELFARITRALAEAWEGRRDRPAALARAVHDNGRLWRALAADVADPGNALPPELRARLFYLHEFSVAHGRKVLDGSAEAGALVEVNRAVMRGLRGEGGAA